MVLYPVILVVNDIFKKDPIFFSLFNLPIKKGRCSGVNIGMQIGRRISDLLSPYSTPRKNLPNGKFIDINLSCGNIIKIQRYVRIDATACGKGRINGPPILVGGYLA